MDARSGSGESNRLVIGFLAGAIGAALAMVCAPRLGDLRRRISASTTDLGDRATGTGLDVGARVAGAGSLAANGHSVRGDMRVHPPRVDVADSR